MTFLARRTSIGLAAVMATTIMGAAAQAAPASRNAASKNAASKNAAKSASAPTSTPGPGQYLPTRVYTVAKPIDTTVRVHAGRTINVRIRTPQGATGALPVILWSHGGGAATNGHTHNAEWANTLARSGYVVISVAHPDAVLFSHCPILGIPANECQPDDFRPANGSPNGTTLISLMYERPLDDIAVLDNLSRLEDVAGVKFHPERIGLAGWSNGTFDVMQLAGSAVDFSPSVHDVRRPDPRVKAFVANSPQGVGRNGNTEHSWDGITRPVLLQTGAGDTTGGDQAPDRSAVFDHLPGPNAHRMYIDSPRAIHGTFGLEDEKSRDLQVYVATTAVAFFDSTLLNRHEATTWLRNNSVVTLSNGLANLTSK